MLQETIQSWLSLHMIHGIGPVTLKNLLSHFGSPEAVLSADDGEIRELNWLNEKTKTSLIKGPDKKALAMAMKKLNALGAWVVTMTDNLYPSLLKEIHDPPILLYGLGDPHCLNNKGVAMVGSRKATTYGMKAAKDLASGLVRHGFTVISGLAPGIDTASHQAAIQDGGCTIAVKGCGLDVSYPSRNRELAGKIQKKGAVITEFPPGTQPEPYNFPRRNRIISGLSLGVVVVEGGEKSGSSITARCALEQNRSVMAVPGSIYSYYSKRPHFLIKDGAVLVENVKDIIQEVSFQGNEQSDESDQAMSLLSTMMSPDEFKLYEKLGAYPVHIDDLVQMTGLPVSTVSGALLQMELKELVQSLPGQMYQRK